LRPGGRIAGRIERQRNELLLRIERPGLVLHGDGFPVQKLPMSAASPLPPGCPSLPRDSMSKSPPLLPGER